MYKLLMNNFWFSKGFASYSFLSDYKKAKTGIMMSSVLNKKWSVSQQKSNLPCAGVINPA